MYEVEVLVLDAEEAQDQAAEFRVDGHRFAYTHVVDETLVLEIAAPISGASTTRVGARSLALALERLKELLS